ncbi:SDR family NAD(P)-dependent oxidoreductase [Cryomorphaceae bacterium 1068]|nr:SDR family NAD(P)-dependent oxidoreductase [Cryomorphaceae bacterium 1068]
MERRKNALVTGASRGIGKATAIELSKRGYTLAVHYVQNKTEAEHTLSKLEGSGHFICKADLSKAQDINQLFDLLYQHFDQLNVVVNNAGVAIKHPLDMAAEDWIENFRKTIEINLHGAALICHHSLQRMMKAGSGTIVNVTSRGAYRSEPSMPGYAASKAGLNSLTQSLAKAAGKQGISVVAVAPGFVETDMCKEILTKDELESVKQQSPLNRIAQPEEVAKLIGFLCEPDSKHLSGAVVDINGASYFR